MPKVEIKVKANIFVEIEQIKSSDKFKSKVVCQYSKSKNNDESKPFEKENFVTGFRSK